MASEIIGTILEKTPKGWRRKSFFYNRRRQLEFAFDDPGDNAPQPAERVPDPTEIHTALREYLSEVAETGEDPLDELRVAVPWIGESWQFRFRDRPPGQQGPLFVGARKNSRGPWLEGADVPAPVRRYLGVAEARDDNDAKIWVCPDFTSLGAMVRAGVESEFVTWQKTFKGENARQEAKGIASIKLRESPDKIRRIVKRAAAERLAELDDADAPHVADPGKEPSR